MPRWRRWLFRFLARTEASASAQFGIARDQVVEVEERVEI
jgi:K+ transporter